MIEYLRRGQNKLFIQGRASGIGKKEFMDNSLGIPFLHDLVRVETLY